eukprot:CAMPEP_0174251140 /NCGR_PEP_ID=MMETSP0439-20130205/1064_1 /TAXON_ID=0 /ORGANISM="Stereomyxa ramosa, Strain Chinc5" /LENGTH=204 /DNA_ID=CAMNT_0015331381 /DNA_START=35 /DNA_END=649 /DNA_ORIENTATION=-
MTDHDRYKRIIIDGRDHILGRLASIVAKQLINGNRVVVVRCEEIVIAGSLFRNKLNYLSFLRKRCNVKPSHGPIHYRAPSKIFWRTVRGMVPHKKAKGVHALKRLKTFEGIPPPYGKMKRLVCPDALRVLRFQPDRPYTRLGDLASQVGWKYEGVIKKLEDKRKIRSKAYYERKKAFARLRTQAEKDVAGSLSEINKELAGYGY